MTRRLLQLFAAIAALYLAVWPHEIGHAAAAFGFGCKANWWQTDTSWFLLSSWGGDIDYQCLVRAKGAALWATEFAGIGVNLLLLAVSPLLGCWWRRAGSGLAAGTWFLFTFFLALSNYAEAFSYLVANSAWLKSDMVSVVTESGVSRWVWFAGSLLLAWGAAWLLRPAAHRAAEILALPGQPPAIWMRRLVIYVVALASVMVLARAGLT